MEEEEEVVEVEVEVVMAGWREAGAKSWREESRRKTGLPDSSG